MHQMFFVTKRAHWGMQNKMRRPLKKKFDVTAGRVDMLHAISKETWRESKEQRRLVEKLGCVRSVVSRMLIAMEKLGLIRREKADYDRRMWLVSLTKKGARLLDRVTRSYLRSGVAKVWVYKAVAGGWWRKKGYRFGRLLEFEGMVSMLREGFNGRGALQLYPFGHPDE
jgi:DNA-binding MarR family transcriptional regulator